MPIKTIISNEAANLGDDFLIYVSRIFRFLGMQKDNFKQKSLKKVLMVKNCHGKTVLDLLRSAGSSFLDFHDHIVAVAKMDKPKIDSERREHFHLVERHLLCVS